MFDDNDSMTEMSQSLIAWGDATDHDQKEHLITPIRKPIFALGFTVGAYSQVSSIGIILQLQCFYVMGPYSITVLQGLLVLLSAGVLEIVHKIMEFSLDNGEFGTREVLHDQAKRVFAKGWLVGSAVLSTISFFILQVQSGYD